MLERREAGGGGGGGGKLSGGKGRSQVAAHNSDPETVKGAHSPGPCEYGSRHPQYVDFRPSPGPQI